MEELKYTLVEHLGELRRRLFTIALVIIAGMIGCYFLVENLVFYVLKPASQLDFIYLTPPELFLAYIKISFVMGICITSPITLYQIWAFLKPALTKKEKRGILISLVVGVLFFILGASFPYFAILPLTIKFFVNLAMPGIEPKFSFGSYVGFINSILLSFGLVFELPMVVVILAKMGIVTSTILQRVRKFSVLIIFILAALLSPPDVVSQFLLAVPLLLLFELSILLAKIIGKRKEKQEN